MLFFDANDGRSIGSIEVNASGAFMVRKGVERASVLQNWPILWTAQTAAVIRIQSPIELKVTDRVGEKEATISYEPRHMTWHVPSAFWEKSQNHDTGNEGADVRINPVGLPAAFGQALTMGERTQPNATAAVAPMTPKQQRRTASRTNSMASATNEQTASNERDRKESEEQDKMPSLVQAQAKNNSVDEPTTQKNEPPQVYDYASLSGLTLNQPIQLPPPDFNTWWPQANVPPAIGAPTPKEPSEFRLEKKANGEEALFDGIGEIEWVKNEATIGVHFTNGLRRAYRHVSGYCHKCMD